MTPSNPGIDSQLHSQPSLFPLAFFDSLLFINASRGVLLFIIAIVLITAAHSLLVSHVSCKKTPNKSSLATWSHVVEESLLLLRLLHVVVGDERRVSSAPSCS